MFYKGISEGYNNIPWGASLDEVKDTYPEIEKYEIIDCEQYEEYYSMHFGDYDVRIFQFYKGQLCKVIVIYVDISTVSLIDLKEKIIKKYGGKWVDYDREVESDYSEPAFLYFDDGIFHDTFIDLFKRSVFNSVTNAYDEWAVVNYSRRSISKEIDNDNLNDSMNDLEL